MKVLLVNPPSGNIDRTYLAPPLGLLTLAAVLREHNHALNVLDLNLAVLENPTLGESSNFYDFACGLVRAQEPDVIGLTSMCLESPLTLELARRIRDEVPNIVTVLGGTHFGSIAAETLQEFPCVDFVVKGEAEFAFPAILAFCSNNKLQLPSNVLYRLRDRIVSGRDETRMVRLEELPFPAYDLADLDRYFDLNPAHLLNYEAGRGCVFKCSFCYSPFQYGNSVRNKKAEKVVEDLQRLVALGGRHIFFVQDNLLNSPSWAAELCRQIALAALPLTWECYATYPQLSDSLTDLLAEAGCKGIFTGVDAVANETKVRMNKPFMRDWKLVSKKLSYCLERGVQPLCAFILEEPEQDQEKNEAAIQTALRAVELGCEIHLNTLTMYNGTSLRENLPLDRFHYSTIKTELLMDTPQVVRSNSLAQLLPHLFPYHSTTSDLDSWEVFVAKVYVLSTLVEGLKQTLINYVIAEENSIWKLLSFVDRAFVTYLKDLDALKRRESVILEFVRRINLGKLSSQTRIFMRRELASLIFSKKNSNRQVKLTDGSGEEVYALAWFADLETNSSISIVLDPADIVDTNMSLDNGRREFAFLSQNKTIRVFSISSEFVRVLKRIESASSSNTTAEVSSQDILKLTEDGWIWALPARNQDKFQKSRTLNPRQVDPSMIRILRLGECLAKGDSL